LAVVSLEQVCEEVREKDQDEGGEEATL